MHDTALEAKVVRESGGGNEELREELKDVMSLTREF